MSLEKEVIKSAVDGKYTEFSNAIKQELRNKMANSDVGKSYASNYDKIQSMKQAFAKINADAVSQPEE